ncbi:MAG: hypothetical protein CVV12_04895 [Gammaproteobacteria bacterium HGW-Gammaproteobacteria-2]|jgi:hypothetical protein|nr:MAG: hypothetical protein CVV12_04895 [Gammaproteobacteria bacterium HGW-Gammaproteobacteria-2]
MSARPRRYLHGDKQARGAFWCKRCEDFMPAAHFADGSHDMTEADHLRLLAEGAVSWAFVETKYTRPHFADNALIGTCARRIKNALLAQRHRVELRAVRQRLALLHASNRRQHAQGRS